MAKFFSSRIVGAERIHKLTQLEDSIRKRVADTIEARAKEVLAGAQAKVSGSVLNVRKGRLLRSLQVQTYDSERGPGAKVYSRWYIARFYEVGYGGKTVPVKGHTRHVKARDVKERVANEQGKLRKKKTGQGIAFVKAHDRKVPSIKKSFLKTTLDEQRASIRQSLEAAARTAA